MKLSSLPILVFLCFVSACSNQSKELQEQLRQRDVEVGQLNERVRTLNKQIAETESSEELVASLEAESRSLSDRNRELERALEEKDQEIERLTATLTKAKDYVNKLRQPKSATPAAARAPKNEDPRITQFIHRPVGMNPDLFPLRVFGISSKHGVISSQRRSYETSKEYDYKHGVGISDPYRTEKKEEYTTKAYGHTVSFKASNLTKLQKRVAAYAGSERKMLIIEPGAQITGEVVARKGEPLQITVDGDTRQFTVSY